LDTTISQQKKGQRKKDMIPLTNNWCLWKYKNINNRHIHLQFTPIQQRKGIEKCFSVSNT
jgi:hypothetical protein